ncbi:MAG: 23S rRNA (uracil(1939)-C(5))-methyltransferase RlmD [Pseudomonadales bacterium]|nr:23S rRNA (uracil(1939)-C(5))-methyltransferase RlmD [Pseudomonadales bacterium]
MKKRFEPVQVEITGLHADGYGLTDNERLCVLGVLPGETVTALPFTKKKKKIFAKPVSLHKVSPDRVEPICSAADYCGGCSLQHFSATQQLAYKQVNFVNTLGLNQPQNILPAVTGPISNYRSKARLGVRFVDKKSRLLVGFREKMKPYIAEIDSCPVLREPVSSLIPMLVELISGLVNVKSIPQIEVAIGDDDTALVFRHLEPMQDSDLELMCQFGARHKIDMYLQPGNAASVKKIYPLEKVSRLHYVLSEFDLKFAFHPLDFTQVNQAINEKMLILAIKLLKLDIKDQVLDAFCGIGNFSLALARTAGFVTGIESTVTSVERAQENALTNQINNCQFLVQDLFDELLDLPVLNDVNKVLLDPPRSGAFEVCKKLANNKVERVVYVSCNPVTLARDAAILVESGYLFEYAGVIDMFPHTTHIESIACFSYNDSCE